MKKRKVSKSIAVIISTVTNPFFVLYLSLILGNFSLIISEPNQSLIFLIINLTLPVVFYIYTLLSNKQSILHFPTVIREDRYLIFLSAVFSSLISTILFSFTSQNIAWVYNSMLICIIFAIYYMINKYIDKISLHAGIFCFSMIYLTDKAGVLFAIFLALLPLICWARIKLHQHTWFQLLLGSGIGMFLGLLAWTF